MLNVGLQISRSVTKEDTWLQDTARSLPERTEGTGEDEKHLQTHEPAATGVHLWSEEQQNPMVKSKQKFLNIGTQLLTHSRPASALQAAQQDRSFPRCTTKLAELSPLRHASLRFERATF